MPDYQPLLAHTVQSSNINSSPALEEIFEKCILPNMVTNLHFPVKKNSNSQCFLSYYLQTALRGALLYSIWTIYSNQIFIHKNYHFQKQISYDMWTFNYSNPFFTIIKNREYLLPPILHIAYTGLLLIFLIFKALLSYTQTIFIKLIYNIVG